MTEMVLVVAIGGRRAALAAERVNSVIEPAQVVPVPCAPPHIGGLAALRSRPLTIIDCRSVLGFPPLATRGAMRAVVVEHDGHLYGLKVDEADDIVSVFGGPQSPTGDPGEGWSEVAAGMVETAAGPLLLLDIARLVDPLAQAKAA